MTKAQRAHIWRHNGLRVSAVMAHRILEQIERAPSTSIQAKAIARTMLNCCKPLHEALKERIDP